ncbi:hypothetical protein HPB48_013611 [Haemaphysalis longicornis]|uniref:Uncharacterized protein n=1 Tax=Haemaphysalis longicornis TaxID=44386 RepID=A0A9J6FVK4_HAELO|nr:hypothetical protein HPB48_013611 [Haemaphysalis longicornis]
MHPEHYANRPVARAKAFHSVYGSNPDNLYTDAADYPALNGKVAAVANSRGVTITSGTVRFRNRTEEEVGNSTRYQHSPFMETNNYYIRLARGTPKLCARTYHPELLSHPAAKPTHSTSASNLNTWACVYPRQ